MKKYELDYSPIEEKRDKLIEFLGEKGYNVNSSKEGTCFILARQTQKILANKNEENLEIKINYIFSPTTFWCAHYYAVEINNSTKDIGDKEIISILKYGCPNANRFLKTKYKLYQFIPKILS